MNYTAHQEEAIKARGEDLLISAAAGSGKTRVLVDRIVRLLAEDHVPLEQMLIVTFTNAAAGEMKARLRQGLTEAAAQAEGEARAFLLAQLEALPEAHISTMHAFCIAELRRFYHVLGLDPAFKILPEATNTILREEALEQTMDAAYAEDDANFLRLVDAYGGRNNDTALRELVRSLHARIQAHADPLAWLDAEVARYGEPLPQAYQTLMRGILTEHAETFSAQLAEARRLAALLPNAEKLYLMLDDDEGNVRRLRHAAAADDVADALAKALANVSWSKKPSKPRNATAEEAEIDEALKALRNTYKKDFTELGEKLCMEGGGARIDADRAMLKPYLTALAALVRQFDAAYQAAKRARSGLDFNDLEHEMLRLLADDEARAAVQAEVRDIFFDEYQDANPIQEAIVEALATSGHLFFVGDVKQAIYRFRRADPKIFNRRYARYRDSADGRLIFLSENFRSRAEILDFANALFSGLMTPALGEVDYQEPGQALVCGGTFEPDAEAVQCVAVQDAERVQNVEAEWIAGEIERLVASGRYDYGDMVVLMRSPKKKLHDFEEVFKRRHIPYYSDNSTVGFENLEVRLFIAMLTVLANDAIDTALLSALLSPFGGLNDTEIATIRLQAEEGSFQAACRQYQEANTDAISRKLNAFYDNLSRWRAALRYEPLAEVALRMLAESGYGAFLLGMDDGVERQQNVMAFIDTIAEYERGHRYGLPGFLHHVETLKAQNMDSTTPGIGLSENDHCVRIMSIHKSKGLGFKVVFLADMAHQFNFMDSKQPLVIDDQLGVAMDVVDLAHGTSHASFEKTLINIKSKQETRSEEVRLLYVALTRAIDRLYLVTTMNEKKLETFQKQRGNAHANTGTFLKGNSYADWLMACLCDPNHALSLDAAKPLYVWQFVESIQEETAEDVQTQSYAPLLAAYDQELTEEIGARFHLHYAYEEATKQPFKKTVSQLAKSNRILPDYVQEWPTYAGQAALSSADVPVPAFIQEHLSFTGAALGTLMHQVVQWLPLRAQSRAEIVQGLAELEERAFLTLEERAAVDVDMLEGFYQSDFVAHIVNTAKHVEREVSFTMHKDGFMVDGQIDLFFETEEGYEIVDFKTDRSMHAERYRQQLALYAQALSDARKKPVTHRWLYWLRFQTAEEV